MGPVWGRLRGLSLASWGPLGASWALLEAIVWLFERPWMPFLGHLGGHRSRKWGPSISAAPLEPPKSPRGALFGVLGAVLGPYWASLWALLGHRGAILGLQNPIGSEQARRHTSFMFCRFAKGFGLLVGLIESLRCQLVPSWGHHGVSWRHIGGRLGYFVVGLRRICSYIKASGVTLEPYCAKRLPQRPPKSQTQSNLCVCVCVLNVCGC